jgi:hypothetical protein
MTRISIDQLWKMHWPNSAAGRTVEIVICGGSALLQPKTRLGLEGIFSNREIEPAINQTPSSSRP